MDQKANTPDSMDTRIKVAQLLAMTEGMSDAVTMTTMMEMNVLPEHIDDYFEHRYEKPDGFRDLISSKREAEDV